ncbi:MAG: InlB B-repeat-containing protein, partial [Lachnospiraceae bacterium]|nr:InlB B-repeat-containing protein [Lachnospiraceae bacterium]
TENPGTENGDTENPGTENGDTENPGTENGDTENTGNENGDTENPGTEDGDTENPEDPDAEDGDPEDLGDAEADESLEEVVEDKDAKAAAVKSSRATSPATISGMTAGGWNESIYAEVSGIKANDVAEVSYSNGSKTIKLGAEDLDYLVRDIGSVVRIDIPGVAAGTYSLTVKAGSNGNPKTVNDIKVYAYDRSGYAHFNYTSGVGAYNDDGTLKPNAIVLYVTDENKNKVTLTVGNTTVTGIGSILNSVGKECGEAGHEGQCRRVSGKKVYYAKANDNQNIITKLSEANIPLVVRFIGAVSDTDLKGASGTFNAASTPKIDGLTIYDSYDNGGSPGDNGHMARIQSGKNITLEGIGYDAAIDGWGFHFMAESSTTNKGFGKSFEVRNLKFVNTPEDAIGMEGQQDGSTISAGVERCWIHNNEFYCPHITSPAESDKSEGDGSVDFKRGQYFTCSYNYFDSCHKTNLVGSSDSSLQYNLTYHHNYWYMCKARGPLTRQANVHMYNNIFDMQTDYAMNTRANAYIFSESNLFYACKNPHMVEAGAIKSWNDSIASAVYNKGSKGTVVSSREEAVSSNCAYNGTSYSSFENNASLFYKNNYQLQDGDFVSLRKTIASQTGRQKQNPKRPEAVTKSDYSVVTRMSGGKTPESFDIENGPVTKTPGKISKTVYVFEVGADFDVEVEYATGSKAYEGVIVDEEGKNWLEGSGKALNLPAGKYMIQATEFQPGDPSKGTIAVFKDFTINSLKISKNNPNAHVHKYALVNTIAATCTGDGKKVYECKAVVPDGGEPCTEKTKEEPIPKLGHDYVLVPNSGTAATCETDGSGTFKCSRCSESYTGTVPKLGHKWGNWTTVTPATANTEGEEKRVCANDPSHVETKVIPVGGSGTTNPNPGSGGVTVAGDYELYFTGGRANGDTDFFTFESPSYKTGKPAVTVNGEAYTACLNIDSKAKLSFSCNDGASLLLVFGTAGKKLAVDGTIYTSAQVGDNIIIKIDNLAAGKHIIDKGGKDGTSDDFIFYVSVSNGSSNEVYHILSFDYNYDDSPDAKEVSVLDGTIYSEEELLALAALTRFDYMLNGLYTDPFCQNAVTYPYRVTSNATLYADWMDIGDNEVIEKTYSLIFDSNGGTPVATVRVADNQLYRITQKPTKDGYAFAGWYDAKDNGNLVEVVDGAELTGNMTVYAHWNISSNSFSLDCAKDLNSDDISTLVDANDASKGRNITSKVTKNGFTLHALPEGGGSSKDDPKYYMTVKKDLLYTNGVILDDTSIDGNNDGLLKTIEFEAPGAGELTVKVASSGDLKDKNSGNVTHTCTIVLSEMVNGTLKEVSTRSLTDTTQREITIDIESAGKYYLYAAKQKAGELPVKGVAYSSISFSQPKYTILYQTKGGTAAGIDVNEPKVIGDTIQLPTTCTLDGYTFEGWLIGDSTDAVGKDTVYTYTVSAEDASNGVITITAKYTPVEYTIKYSAGDGTMDSNSDSAMAGSVVSLPKPTPPEDKVFVGWTIGTDDSKRTLATSYTVRAEDADANKVITFTAEYKDKPVVYTVKFVADGGNLPSDLQGDKSLEEGRKIVLSAYKPTSNGQRFIGWQINNVDLEDPVYTVKATDADANKTITIKAVFKPEYTVNFDTGVGTLPSGMASGRKYIEGEEVTLGECTLDETSENKFGGWYIKDPNALIKDSSYIVNPEDADAETKTITITAKYVPKGAKNEGIYIIGLEKEYQYTGAKIIPNIGVVDYNIGDDGKVLSPGVDYTVKYKNNKNVGEATVTVTGKGNYAGKDTKKTFKIKAVDAKNAGLIDKDTELVDLKGARIAKINSVEYTGKEWHPAFTLTLKGKTPTEYLYNETKGRYETKAEEPLAANVAVSNNINKGTATILITGKVPTGKTKATSVKKTFKITAIDLAKNASKVKVETAAGTYSVKGAAPGSIKVTYDGKELRKGTDYTVKYTGNKKVTTSAKVVITGKGNYAKKVTGTTYEIKPLDMSKLEVRAVNAYKDMKAGKVKATVLDGNGNILKPSQYTLNVYSDNVSGTAAYDSTIKLPEGKIYVEAVAKDTVNLSSKTPKAEFNVAIAKKNIAKAKIKLNKDSKTNKTITKVYNGNEQGLKKEDIKVTIKENGKEITLDMGTDFMIAGYSNNVNKGTATAIIKGIGSYSGTKTVKFKIVGKTMAIDGEDGITWNDVTGVISSFMKKLAK